MVQKLGRKKIAIIIAASALVVILLCVFLFTRNNISSSILGKNTEETILATNIPGATEAEQPTIAPEAVKKATIPLKAVPAPDSDIKKCYVYTVGDNNIFFPKFDTRLDLMVASLADKPTSAANFSIVTTSAPKLKLLTSKSVYTKSNYIFVDENSSAVRWFAFQLNNAQDAKNVVWQVSTLPFSGGQQNWKTPNGLLSTGQVLATDKQFSIDFKSISVPKTQTSATIKTYPIPQAQKTYFVRAIPVNALGVPIGDPGSGMKIMYGQTLPMPAAAVDASLQLWTPKSLQGNYTSEFSDLPAQDPFKNGNIVNFPADQPSAARLFYYKNVAADAASVIIQVSTSAFDATNIYPDTQNLIYEKVYTMPLSAADLASKSYVPSVLVPFGQFGKKPSEMQADQYVNYYVRGVVLSPSIQQGRYNTVYTDTVTVKYGFASPTKIINTSPYDKQQTLNVSLPKISMVDYVPVQWSDPAFLSHYYVFRLPKAGEINCNWENLDTKEVLMPYNFTTESIYRSEGINSKEDYENIVIPRVLPVGTKVYFPPPTDEDKPWYDELYDAIVGFFEDLSAVFSAIYSAIQTSYATLKSDLVNFVADLCPIPELRGAFADVLSGLVDYGLMSLGIPPTLPDFSELSSMSVDYLAEVALTEAGVPADSITDAVTQQVSDGIGKQLATMKNTPDANPVSSPFLKLDPDYTYRPAYVDLLLDNQTDYPTAAGTIDLNVTFNLDYYGIYGHVGDPSSALNLTCDNNYKYGSALGITTSSDYFYHFEHGLNGNTVNYQNGGEAIYQVFDPVVNTKIPVIPKKSSQKVRIYLNPAFDSLSMRYPTADNIMDEDFYNIYFNNGNKKDTHFILSSNFPTASEYLTAEFAKQNGIFFPDAKTKYSYSNENSTSNVTNETVQQPVSIGWGN